MLSGSFEDGNWLQERLGVRQGRQVFVSRDVGLYGQFSGRVSVKEPVAEE